MCDKGWRASECAAITVIRASNMRLTTASRARSTAQKGGAAISRVHDLHSSKGAAPGRLQARSGAAA